MSPEKCGARVEDTMERLRQVQSGEKAGTDSRGTQAFPAAACRRPTHGHQGHCRKLENNEQALEAEPNHGQLNVGTGLGR